MKGLGTALITPFKTNGEVDYEALARLLDTQLTGCVDYIVVLGTTGEAATLTADEKREVRRFIVNYVKAHPLPFKEGTGLGSLPLILGVGGNNTAAVISDINAMRAELILDFTAILSVCPYYNKPSQEGLFRHFCAVAEASPIPVILYNVPGRTGVNLLPETVMRIYEAYPDKIAGIKEASGNVEQIKHLIDLTAKRSYSTEDCQWPSESSKVLQHGGLPVAIRIEQGLTGEASLSVISGDDGIACELMQAGADGLISVASNAFPEDFHRIVHEKDEALQAKYAEMIRLLFTEGNPSGIKTVLAQKGLIQNELRLPLVSNSEALQEAIRQQLAAIGR